LPLGLAFVVGLSLTLHAEGHCQSIAPELANSNPVILFPRTLQAFSQQPLSVRDFGYFGTAQCDDSGPMFFAASPGAVGGITYLSVSADGEEHTGYDVPKYVTDDPCNTSFSISPNGKPQLLYAEPRQPVKWLGFDQDGELSSVTTLSAPSSIIVRSFAVTAQGYLLLLGYYPLTPAHSNHDGETYRAIFNSSGSLVAKLESEASGTQSNGQVAGPVEEPVAVEGEQFFRMASSGRNMVVMNTDGRIVRTLRLPDTRPGDPVNGLRISGSVALVTYINFKAAPQQSCVLLNAATGLEYGLCLPPAGARGGLT
jgi:hypothetical protein